MAVEELLPLNDFAFGEVVPEPLKDGWEVGFGAEALDGLELGRGVPPPLNVGFGADDVDGREAGADRGEELGRDF